MNWVAVGAVATAVAAVATAILAAATYWLAKTTRDELQQTKREITATEKQAEASTKMLTEVQTDRDLNWRPYLRLEGTGLTDALEGQDQIGWKNVGRGPALNVVCARLFYVKANLGGVMTDVPHWRLAPGSSIIEDGGTHTFNLSNPAGPVPMVLFDVLPPGPLNVSVFFQAITGRRAYRLCPPRAEPDVWAPGDKVEPWVSWYFGHLGLQVPT